MQTFVLASQTSKKYYVHNDIFRYQDEVYHDNSDTESEDQLNHDSNSVEYYQQQQSSLVVNPSIIANNDNVTYVSPPVIQPQHEPLPPRDRQPRNEQVNGHQDEIKTAPTPQANEDVEEPVESISVEPVEEKEPPKVEELKKPEAPLVQLEQPAPPKEQAPQQPSSWAKIISNNSLPPASSAPVSRVANTTNLNVTTQPPAVLPQQPPIQQQQQQQQQPQQQQPATKTSSKENRSDKPRSEGFNTNYNGRSNGTGSRGGNNNRGSAHREQQRDQQREQQRHNSSTNDVQTPSNEDSTKFSRHPDAHQVFVGNLQSDISEGELQAYFSQYGPVVDVRINKNTKQQADRRLPNYGFIVFDSKESVENLLRNPKNLIFKDDKGIEHRLNIEEKRARQSGGGGSGGKHQSGNRSSSNGSKGGRPSTNKRTSGVTNNHQNTTNTTTTTNNNNNTNGRRP